MTGIGKETPTPTAYEDDEALRILLDHINLADDRSDLSPRVRKLISVARKIVLDTMGDQDWSQACVIGYDQ